MAGNKAIARAAASLLAVLALAAVGGCAAPPPPEATPTPVATAVSAAIAARGPGVVPTATATATTQPPSPIDSSARAIRGGPPVRREPDDDSPAISGLYYDTLLPLLDEYVDAAGQRWYRTRLWGVLDGWIRADQVTTDTPTPVRPFWEGGETERRPGRAVSPSQELVATGKTNTEVALRTGPGTDYRFQQALAPSTPVLVSAWATDADGHAWYKTTVAGATGWVYAAMVDLAVADPLRPAVDGKPLASFVAGKGMWLPQPLLEMADERQIVLASKQLGLTHLFVEAGETTAGFYASKEVARLLPAAHAAGLRVIGWITTGLNDLPRDVELSIQVADFRTSDGQALDGIAPDIEQNMDLDDVKAYAEITRARLGDDRLFVGVIYPAGGWFGREYPVQPALARVCNALAPMAYWSDEERTYDAGEVAGYVATVVSDLQAAVGPGYPVHVIGQMYDTFGRNGTGVYSPGPDEITAALQASRNGGAVGISFFQWGTATPEEWSALRDFSW